MTPLGRTALGLLLVLLDLRLPGLDVVPDVLGWVLVVGGLGPLVPRCPALAPVRTAAVLAGLLSLADLVHPVVTTADGTSTTSAAVPPEGLQGLLSFGSLVAGLVAVVLLSLRLRDLAATAGDARRAAVLGRFAVYHAVAGGTVVLVGLAALTTSAQGDTDVGGPAALLLVLVVLAALVVEVAFLLTLRGARLEPWALPVDADRTAPPDGGGVTG